MLMDFLLLSILFFISSLLLSTRFGSGFVMILSFVSAMLFAFIIQNISTAFFGELKWIWISVFLGGVVAHFVKLD